MKQLLTDSFVWLLDCSRLWRALSSSSASPVRSNTVEQARKAEQMTVEDWAAVAHSHFIRCSFFAAMSTTFAYPSLHWSGHLLSFLVGFLSWLLRWSVRRSRLGLWLLACGVTVAVGGLHAMLALHPDSGAVDAAARQYWNESIDVEMKINAYHGRFEEMKRECKRHLLVIGLSAIALATVLVRPPLAHCAQLCSRLHSLVSGC